MLTYLYDAFMVLAGPVGLPEVPGLGVQLPSNAIQLDKPLPPASAGHAWALVDGAPLELADNRGLYYGTQDGRPVQVDALGTVPTDLTSAQRPSEFHEWDGEAWVLNVPAQAAAAAAQVKQQRDAALREAATRIAPLQDAVDLGLATAEEAGLLNQWKAYRVQLSRIEQQFGFPLEVEWPAAPTA